MLFSVPSIQAILANALFGLKQLNAKFTRRFGSGIEKLFNDVKDPNNPEYQDHDFKHFFAGCKGYQIPGIETELTANGHRVPLDVVCIESEQLERNNDGQEDPIHFVSSLGVLDYYESFQNLQAMCTLSKRYHAKVYGFNYPGIHKSVNHPPSSLDTVKEFNDLVNAEIAIVNQLLKEGVHPDKIVLHGNCIGSAVAKATQRAFMAKGIKLRVIAGNTYSSFKGVAQSFSTQESTHPWLLRIISFVFNYILIAPLRKYLLARVGWDSRITKYMQATDPYTLVYQREQDLAFREGRLHDKLELYKHIRQQRAQEISQTGHSEIPNYSDPCADSSSDFYKYKTARDYLHRNALLKPNTKELQKTAIFNHAGRDIARLLGNYLEEQDKSNFIKSLISKFINQNGSEQCVANILKQKNIIDRDVIASIIQLMRQANTPENCAKVCSHPLGLHQIDGYYDLLDLYLLPSEKLADRTGLPNGFLSSTDYINKHPQQKPSLFDLPGFLHSAMQKPNLAHILIEGILYGFLLTGLAALIINPLVLPVILSLFGASPTTIASISYGIFYLVFTPVVTLCSWLVAADLFDNGYIPEHRPQSPAQIAAIIDSRFPTQTGTGSVYGPLKAPDRDRDPDIKRRTVDHCTSTRTGTGPLRVC